jgi:hypothetical protein
MNSKYKQEFKNRMAVKTIFDGPGEEEATNA